MSQYKTGTVSTTAGSNVVAGVGTLWNTNLTAGDLIRIGSDAVYYTIDAIATNTSLTLTANYPSTVSSQSYAVYRDYTPNYDYPLPSRGDIGFPEAVAHALGMIDTDLAAVAVDELDDLNDVSITGPLQARDALLYDDTSGVQAFVDRPLVEADISDLQAYLVAADLDDVVYDIASETLDAGTIDSGSYADLDDIGANYMSISEANGADPLTIRFGFTGVGAINQVAIRGYYQGTAGHTIAVEIYNYTAAGYEILGYMPIRTDYAWYVYPLYNYTDYLDSGATTVRLRHVENGVITHDLFLDYVVLKKAIW